tara:strand:+ start:867 stop:1121 length:255 start_codon:yes stop_codon:yes gene_type:complete
MEELLELLLENRKRHLQRVEKDTGGAGGRKRKNEKELNVVGEGLHEGKEKVKNMLSRKKVSRSAAGPDKSTQEVRPNSTMKMAQ